MKVKEISRVVMSDLSTRFGHGATARYAIWRSPHARDATTSLCQLHRRSKGWHGVPPIPSCYDAREIRSRAGSQLLTLSQVGSTWLSEVMVCFVRTFAVAVISKVLCEIVALANGEVIPWLYMRGVIMIRRTNLPQFTASGE